MNIVRGIFSGFFSFALVVVLIALGIVTTINHSILNPSFIISELDSLDVHSIIMNQVSAQLPEDIPYMAEIIDEAATELEPWLKEQTAAIIYAGYAYLKGDAELDIAISLERVRALIKNYLAQTVRESPPPELEGASDAEIEFFLSLAYAEIDRQIPQQIEINEEILGPEITTQLQTAKEVIAYIELAYKVLIGLVALLILLIALIQWWRAKAIARFTGIALTIAGIISLVVTLLAKSIIFQMIPIDIPVEIAAVLPQLISDISYPLLIYSIGVLVTGIGLVILSIKLRYADAENI